MTPSSLMRHRISQRLTTPKLAELPAVLSSWRLGTPLRPFTLGVGQTVTLYETFAILGRLGLTNLCQSLSVVQSAWWHGNRPSFPTSRPDLIISRVPFRHLVIGPPRAVQLYYAVTMLPSSE